MNTFFSRVSTPVAILIGSVIISGAVLIRSGSSSQPNTARIAATPTPPVRVADFVKLNGNDPVLGKENAPVTIVEFSDFQCPFCRRFWIDSFSQLKKDYIDTGKVRLIYRDFPLSIHEQAKPSALAAECANEQGKFWEYHDALFEEQQKLGTGTVAYTTQDLKAWATKIGLDSKKFASCFDNQKYSPEIDDDTKDGESFGVTGTPAFFINGELTVGAVPYATLKSAIDKAISAVAK